MGSDRDHCGMDYRFRSGEIKVRMMIMVDERIDQVIMVEVVF